MRLTPSAAIVLSSRLEDERRHIREQAAEITRLSREIAASGADPDRLWAAAGHLQAFSTGMESMLERVLGEVDGVTPEGPESHRELLRQSAIALPGVRPAVIDADLLESLSPYLGFRHFFRHAYTVRLRIERMAEKLDRAEAVGQAFDAAIVTFQSFLGAVGREGPIAPRR